jgi:transglutaminase-like putative cysteine protease
VNRNRSGLDLALEVAITLLSLAAVAGFARLFDDGVFFWRLAIPTIAAHVLAALARRAGLGLVWSGLLSAVGLVVVLGLVLYPETLTFGIPGAATRDTVLADLEAAWAVFDEVGPPAPVLDGYLVVAATALWLAAFLADWAAFRLHSTVETLLPSGIVFAFCTVYAKDHHREVTAGIELAAILLVLLVHRTRSRAVATTWLGSGTRASAGLLRTGAVIGVLAVGAVALWGTALPGADAAPVVAWRELDDRDGARVTVSPLVDIRASLVEQPSTVVFTVDAAEADYWRLTSLDRFDGLVWESSGSFGDADGALPSTLPEGSDVRTLEQTFTIRALGDFWLPAAFEPAAVTAAGGADPVYEAASGTLVVGRDVADADGLTYSLVSRVPVRDAAAVTAADGPIPGSIAERYLALPADFDPAVAALAADITAGETTPAGRARALQDWFRTGFTYDLQVASGHSIDSIADFLALRRGYCEQFAGTYAAMARSIGLPARVAVGFTPGERQGDTFTVRGEHAHAWPEVWIAGVGWLRFEPTPGRGAPGDTAYTGVEPSQAAAGDGAAAVPVPVPTTVPPTSPGASPTVPSPGADDLGDLPPGLGGGGTTTEDERGDRLATAALVIAVLGVLALATVPVLKAARRRAARRRATDPRRRIHLAWTELLDDLERSGLGRTPAETPIEHADRVAPRLASGAQLRTLADLVTSAAFAPSLPDPSEETAAATAAAAVREDVRATSSLVARCTAALDPRPLVRRSPQAPSPDATAGADREPVDARSRVS